MVGEELRLLGYCGLFCGLCAHRNRIPQRARVLRETLYEDGWDSWYRYDASLKDAFPVFWDFLDRLVNLDYTCRTGGGPQTARYEHAPRRRE